MGATPEFIATELKLNTSILTAHYEKDLTLGLEEANVRVARTFFDMATSGEFPAMTLAWMRMRAQWSDNSSPASSDEESLADANAARDKLAALLNNRPEVVDKLKKA